MQSDEQRPATAIARHVTKELLWLTLTTGVNPVSFIFTGTI
jgi:hypothetical protein